MSHEYRTKTVHLHGGPWHGRVVNLVAEADHFHVMGMDPSSLLRGIIEDQDNPAEIDTREGTYSQVSGPNYRNDFEWDGWVSH